VWRLFLTYETHLGRPFDDRIDYDALNESERNVFRKTHWTIAKVLNDMNDNFHFNTAISATMELSNELYAFSDGIDPDALTASSAAVLRFAYDSITRLLAPMTPHLAEELWFRMGHGESVFENGMPSANPEYTQAEVYDLVIQVNSKIRAKESIPTETDEDGMRAVALANERIQELLAGKEPRKVIVIPNRLVNIVI